MGKAGAGAVLGTRCQFEPRGTWIGGSHDHNTCLHCKYYYNGRYVYHVLYYQVCQDVLLMVGGPDSGASLPPTASLAVMTRKNKGPRIGVQGPGTQRQTPALTLTAHRSLLSCASRPDCP